MYLCCCFSVEQLSEKVRGEWFSVWFQVEVVFAVLVLDLWSPAVDPVLEGFPTSIRHDFCGRDVPGAIVFLRLGDGDVSSFDVDVGGRHCCWFAGESPSDDEVVGEQVLDERVFVLVVGIVKVQHLVYLVWERYNARFVNWLRWCLVAPDLDAVRFEEHPHGFPFVGERSVSCVFYLLTVVHVRHEVF